MTVFLTPVWSRMMSSALLVLGLGVSTALAEESTGKSFVENFDVMDPSFWYVSNGWNNGAHQNCTWSKKLVRFDNGQLELGFRDGRAGDRNYSCGEIQTKGRYRYGTYEARIKAATGSGLNSAFFTYIGPVHKKPHDEIDMEILGKDMSQVQLNQYISAKGGNEKLADVAGDADKAFNDYAFIWEPKRLRYFVNGKMVHEVTDPSKIPQEPQKIFFSLWGTDTLKGWMGQFAYRGPTAMRVDRVAFTAPGDACQFPESIACQQN